MLRLTKKEDGFLASVCEVPGALHGRVHSILIVTNNPIIPAGNFMWLLLDCKISVKDDSFQGSGKAMEGVRSPS